MTETGRADESALISTERATEIQRRLFEWARSNYREFPWRSTEDPFAGLIAEILLQRTRAESVVPVYEVFLQHFPDAPSLASAPVEEIEAVIYPLGLRWRAPLLKQLGATLVRVGHIPESLDELTALPGVGPYTAAAWLSFHGRGRGVLIDANVVRWICRLVGRPYDGETRRKRWLKSAAEQLTPHNNVSEFNYGLLDFTMTICTPGVPRCEICPLGAELCEYGYRRLNH